ncbi:hypothetical protein [Nocardia carnea]|uniref:hypothetical protein n=1 Tax=Nocardia carnea TaxID=37328 RepID=UPI002455C190|nr:hypothetical protein [Nocardia carnea]
MPGDTAGGLAAQVRWYEDHPPTVEAYGQLLDAAVDGGAITSRERADLAARTPIEGVAALRALLVQVSAALAGGGQ